MAEEIIYERPWMGKYSSRIVVICVLIFIIFSSETLKGLLHKAYNFLPPQKVRLNLFYKDIQSTALQNQLVVLDQKDTFYTDNEGLIDKDLAKGSHTLSTMYVDSVHNDVVNLYGDSSVNITMIMKGNDLINGSNSDPALMQANAAETKIKKTKVIYGAQYFKVGNSLQFGRVNVKFLRLDDVNNAIYVRICHTVTDWVCQSVVVDNAPLTRDALINFADDNYNYKLLLQKIDKAGPQNTLVAYVSMEQILK